MRFSESSPEVAYVFKTGNETMKEIRDAIHNVVQDKEVKEALYYFASHLGDVSRKDADSYLKGKKTKH
jgi:hypothetical protein